MRLPCFTSRSRSCLTHVFLTVAFSSVSYRLAAASSVASSAEGRCQSRCWCLHHFPHSSVLSRPLHASLPHTLTTTQLTPRHPITATRPITTTPSLTQPTTKSHTHIDISHFHIHPLSRSTQPKCPCPPPASHPCSPPTKPRIPAGGNPAWQNSSASRRAGAATARATAAPHRATARATAPRRRSARCGSR